MKNFKSQLGLEKNKVAVFYNIATKQQEVVFKISGTESFGSVEGSLWATEQELRDEVLVLILDNSITLYPDRAAE